MMIAGVSNIDTEVLEKSFRNKRHLSSTIKRGRKPAIENLRLVLKNWWTREQIPDSELGYKNIQRYRGLVYKYLKEPGTSEISESLKLLIDEYKDFISNKPDEDNSIVVKPNLELVKNLKVESNKQKKNKINKNKTKKETKSSITTKPNEIKVPDFIEQLKSLGVKEFTIKF